MSGQAKKRKRSTDAEDTGGTGKRTKKIASQSPNKASAKVKVTVFEGHDDWIPALVSTPGISPPNEFTFTAYRKTRDVSPSVESIQSSSPHNLILHSSAHERIDYLAKEEDDSRTSSLRKEYVGIFDPATGEVRVVEVLKMVMRASVKPTEGVEAEHMTYLNQRNDLGLAFGTKKAKKTINSLKTNAIDPTRDASQQSSTTAIPESPRKLDERSTAVLGSMDSSTGAVFSREQKEAIIAGSKPIPTPNLDALTPEEVYPIEKIVGHEMLKQMTILDWQETVKAGAKVQASSKFLYDRIERLIQTEQIRKVKVSRYFLLLLFFYRSLKPSRGKRKLPEEKDLEEALGVPVGIVRQIKKRFTNGPMITKKQVDFLVANLITLALIIGDFEVDTFELQEDLALEPRQMKQYFRELGCKIDAMTDAEMARAKITTKARAALHKMARLKIPLEFPKVRARSVKKKPAR